MKLVPILDKVVLKKDVPEEKTKSGIILAAATKEDSDQGIVVAAGPGGNVDGKDVVMVVKEGDKVIFRAGYDAKEVKIDDEEYVIIKQSDILAIVED